MKPIPITIKTTHEKIVPDEVAIQLKEHMKSKHAFTDVANSWLKEIILSLADLGYITLEEKKP